MKTCDNDSPACTKCYLGYAKASEYHAAKYYYWLREALRVSQSKSSVKLLARIHELAQQSAYNILPQDDYLYVHVGNGPRKGPSA